MQRWDSLFDASTDRSELIDEEEMSLIIFKEEKSVDILNSNYLLDSTNFPSLSACMHSRPFTH